MRKATPKDDDILLLPEKESTQEAELIKELEAYFSTDNGYYLDKALVLLHQFLAGRPDKIVLDKEGVLKYKPKRIKITDIQGLSLVEITVVMQYLSDAFCQPVIQKVGMYDTPRFDDGGRLIKSAEFILENTELLDTAIFLLENLKADKQKYLLLKDDIFIYNSAKLEVNAGTHTYSFLRAIYEYLKGQSGEISYKQLAEEVRKNKRYKDYTDIAVKDTLQKSVTTKAKGEFGYKLKSVEANNKPLIETIKDFGVRFNNG